MAFLRHQTQLRLAARLQTAPHRYEHRADIHLGLLPAPRHRRNESTSSVRFWDGSVAGTVQASASRRRPTACRSAGMAASHRLAGVLPGSECTHWWQALCTQWSSSWLTSSRLVTWWRAGSPSPVTSTRNGAPDHLEPPVDPASAQRRGALRVSLLPNPAGPRISGSPARQASTFACGSGRSVVRPPSWRSRRRGGRARRRSPSRCPGPSSGSSWFHRPADRTARAGSGGRWPARLGPASAC